MRSWSPLLLASLFVIGCNNDKDSADTDTDTVIDEATTDTGTATDTDTDTVTDTETGPVTDISHLIHETIESIIVVRWEQLTDDAIAVEYSFDEGEWHSAPAIDGAGPQEQILLGIPYDTEVTYRLVDSSGAALSDDATATTGSPPEDTPTATVLESDPDNWEATGNYLYTSVASSDYFMWRIIIDRKGRLVWAQANAGRGVATFYTRISYDGDDLMWDEADVIGTSGERVYRMKIDGTIVDSYETPRHHHAFVDLPDESIVWGAYGGPNQPELLKKVHPDGTEETLWTSQSNWESNSIFWNEEDDTFLYSFYTHMTVLEIDHATGTELRRWGQQSDWAFDPVESLFDWQHGVTWTDEGTLLLSTHVSLDSNEGVTREYVVSDDDESLVEVWNFGVGDGIPAPYYGESHRLPGGNTMQNYGTNTRLREATTDGTVVWDVEWVDYKGRPGELMGRSIYLEDLYAFAP